MARKGFHKTGDAARSRAAQLIRAVGPDEASTILGVRRERVEKWGSGLGWTSRKDENRLRMVEANIDLVRGMHRHNVKRPVDERVSRRGEARAIREVLDKGGRARMSRRDRMRITGLLRLLGYGPNATTPYVKRGTG